MKKRQKIIVLGIALITSISGGRGAAGTMKLKAPTIKKKKTVTVTATVYNPVEGQTDDSPLATADGSKIDLKKLKKKRIKWIAVSRDLKDYYEYGSKVKLTCSKYPGINGIYEVHDTMNKRFSNRIDILSAEKDSVGLYKEVKIEAV